MSYLSIVSVLPTVDVGQCTPSLERRTGVLAGELNNVLLCSGSAAKCILAT